MRNNLLPIKTSTLLSILPMLLFFGNSCFGNGEAFKTFLHNSDKIILLEKPISVCDNVTDGGLIEGDEIDCPDPVFDPSPITNVALPSGGTGTLEYLWIFTTGDPLGALTVWTPIPNSNTEEYDPGPITVTTHYMRCARRNECLDYSGESNFVTKEIVCCQNVTDGGMIGTDQSICGDSLNPDLLENLVSPSGGMGNLEYQWFSNTTGVPFDPNNPDWILISGATNEDFDPDMLFENTFFIRCSKRDSCVDFDAKSNIVEISLFDSPQIDSTSFEDLTCFESADGSINIYPSGGMAPFDFNWFPTSINSANLTSLSAGNYSVLVTDANGCAAGDSLRFSLTEPEEIVVESESWKQNCDQLTGGAAAVRVVSGGIAPFTYLWSDINGTTNDSLIGVPAGSYTVSVTDATGCEVVSSVQIDLGDLLTASFATSYPTCFGFSDGMTSVIPSGGSGQYSYAWNDPLFTTDSILVNVAAGTYILTITDSDGCELIDSTTLIEPAEMTVSIDVTNGGCDMPLGFATATPMGGSGIYTYEWSPSLQNTPTATDLPDGQVFILVTDDNGCTATERDDILNVPVLSITTDKEDFDCMLGVNGSAWVTATGGQAPYSYAWSDPSMTNTDTVRNLMSGTYSVTVIDDLGCERVSQVDVENISPLSVTIEKADNNCPGDEKGNIKLTVLGGEMPYSYLWDDPMGSTTDEISDLPNRIYNATITDANGCQEFAQAEIVQMSDLEGSIRKSDLRCFGLPEGVAEVLPTGGVGVLTYEWSNNSQNSVLRNLSAGRYVVTVTDENMCEFIDSVTLTQPAELICEAIVVQPISTFNGSDGVIEVIASGGVAPLTFRWNGGQTDQRLENIPAGNYLSATVDQNGCESLNAVTLVNPSRLAGFVWDDDNQNGLQEVSEAGIVDVKVTLTGTDSDGNVVNIIGLTDAAGQYSFDGISGGDYEITFDLPTDFHFTEANVGMNDNIDSDPDTLTGKVLNIFLNQGAQRHYDAGMFMRNSNTTIEIGDYVWIDSDRDGVQDGIEAGIPGFRVYLIDAVTDQPVENVLTDLSGEYLFQDVAPGDYYIVFDESSLPSDYKFTLQNSTTDDLDSDADSDGETAVFTVTLGQNDDLTHDAGIHPICDDVTNGGVIGSDEVLCGIANDPAEITNISFPAGGFGTLEYLWLSSFTNIYNGPGDPNWSVIPNSNSASFDPSSIIATTYYIRCTRRAGCSDFLAESNIVKKELVSEPDAEILNPPTGACTGDEVDFFAKSLGGGVTYFWTFSNGATPSTANGRVVNDVVWNSSGIKNVELTVTRFGCSAKDLATFNVVVCNKPQTGNAQMMAYPNPVSNLLKINILESQESKIDIQLVDVFGVTQKKVSLPGDSRGTELDLTNLPEGIYFLKTGSGIDFQEMTKIIIQK